MVACVGLTTQSACYVIQGNKREDLGGPVQAYGVRSGLTYSEVFLLGTSLEGTSAFFAWIVTQ